MIGRINKTISLTLLVICIVSCCLLGAAVADGEHQITFSLNYAGATEAIYQTVEDGASAVEEKAPTREGYVFIGWFTSKMCVTPYDFSQPVIQDIRLFAGWQIQNAVVTLVSEGEVMASLTVENGQALSQPDAPMREGYEFRGWYMDARGRQAFDFDRGITENTTLYAIWEQAQATVTFQQAEGVAETVTVSVGSPVERPEIEPTREDYAFEGWYADVLLSTPYDFYAPVMADSTIYAGWKLAVATVTLDPNHDGVEAWQKKVPVGETLEADVPEERYGYEFDAWYLDPACTVSYDFAQPVEGNLTIYAGWQRHLFTVTAELNDGASEPGVYPVAYEDRLLELSDPVREGYTFIGWYTDASGRNLFSFETPVTGDMTIYAGWQSAETQSASGEAMVTFYLNDGTDTVYHSFSSKTGRKLASKLPDQPQREGYFFVGWAGEADGAELMDTSSARITGDMELYAIWYRKYTFEAEYTLITGKRGQGYSNNVSGLDLIYDVTELDNGAELGISNDNYVGDLYYNGAFLEFNVNAEADAKETIFVLRLSVELYDMYLNDRTWQVEVNGETVPYGDLVLEGAIPSNGKDAFGNTISGIKSKRAFEDYVLDAKIPLRQGRNTIRLVTNNSTDHGGTFNAETPLIDCLYICSPVPVSWAECYPENVGQTLSDVVY